MLIVEIILTIVAWNKGYKWYSLIPVGATLFVGFMLGFALGGNADYMETVYAFWWVDGLAIVALILMLIFNPYKKVENEKKGVLEENPNKGQNNT